MVGELGADSGFQTAIVGNAMAGEGLGHRAGLSIGGDEVGEAIGRIPASGDGDRYVVGGPHMFDPQKFSARCERQPIGQFKVGGLARRADQAAAGLPGLSRYDLGKPRSGADRILQFLALNKCAAPLIGAQHALAGQCGYCAPNRVAIDAKTGGQIGFRRQAVSGQPFPGSNITGEVFGNLAPQGDAVAAVYGEGCGFHIIVYKTRQIGNQAATVAAMKTDTEASAAAAEEIKQRRTAMGLLARSNRTELERLWSGLRDVPKWRELRPPETGMVMIRGRAGGDGREFNFGEVTVTRCTVALTHGPTGAAYVMGRDKAHARLAAVCDALWRGERRREIADKVLAPIAARLSGDDNKTAAEVAATKVEFFTLVRGEN
jgi:alpha-D-ribose 1-methylphosphonate 5-triphosphate synthase subunit PhnG